MESNNLFKALLCTIKNNFVKNKVEILFWCFENNQIKTIKNYEDIFMNSEPSSERDLNTIILKYVHINDQTKIKNTLNDLKKGLEKTSLLFRTYSDQNIVHNRATFEKVINDTDDCIGILILVTDCTNELKEMKEIQYQRLKKELIYTMNTMSIDNVPEIIQLFLENVLIMTESKLGCIYHYDGAMDQFVAIYSTNRFLPDEEAVYCDVETAFENTRFLEEALMQKMTMVVNEKENEMLSRYMMVPVLINEKVVSVLVVSNKEDLYTNNDAKSIKSSIEEIYQVIQLKQNEKSASVNREKFQQTFEKAPLGICFISLEGTFIRVNKKYCDILGHTEQELMKMNVEQLTYPQDLYENLRLHNALKNDEISEYSYEKRYIRADESLVWVKVTANKVKEEVSKDVYIINVIEDITELEQYRSRLEELVDAKTNEIIQIEEELKLFFNTTLDMLCISNFEGYFTKVSTTWTSTLGWSEQELLQRPYMAFVHPDDVEKTIEVMNDLISGINVLNFKNRFLCKAGTYKWIDWNQTALIERKIIISAARDITKQKEIEDALIEAKQKAELAYEAKSEFLANISHEIRTPLNSVIGYAELLEGHLKNPDYINYVKGISSSGRILLSLINDILDLSKLEASKIVLKYDWVNIFEFTENIEKVFTFSAQSKKIKLIIEIDSDFPRYVFMDEIRVRQVLINLIGNGIKFTHEGYVRLIVTYEKDPNQTDENHLIFIVEDTGIGIIENSLEVIFDAFTQQKSLDLNHYGGSGLGLAICKKLLYIMNGEIYVESQLNKGSIFKVKIRNIKLNDLKHLNQKVLEVDEQLFMESINENLIFKDLLIHQLMQFKNALKMNLMNQIGKDLLAFGLQYKNEAISSLGQQLLQALTDTDLEQCNRIINFLKKMLITREVADHEESL